MKVDIVSTRATISGPIRGHRPMLNDTSMNAPLLHFSVTYLVESFTKHNFYLRTSCEIAHPGAPTHTQHNGRLDARADVTLGNGVVVEMTYNQRKHKYRPHTTNLFEM